MLLFKWFAVYLHRRCSCTSVQTSKRTTNLYIIWLLLESKVHWSDIKSVNKGIDISLAFSKGGRTWTVCLTEMQFGNFLSSGYALPYWILSKWGHGTGGWLKITRKVICHNHVAATRPSCFLFFSFIFFLIFFSEYEMKLIVDTYRCHLIANHLI